MSFRGVRIDVVACEANLRVSVLSQLYFWSRTGRNSIQITMNLNLSTYLWIPCTNTTQLIICKFYNNRITCYWYFPLQMLCLLSSNISPLEQFLKLKILKIVCNKLRPLTYIRNEHVIFFLFFSFAALYVSLLYIYIKHFGKTFVM